MSTRDCWLPMADCDCRTCAPAAREVPRAWIAGPFRAPDSRFRVALEVLAALLALLAAGAFFGAALGWLE
jgi:transposase